MREPLSPLPDSSVTSFPFRISYTDPLATVECTESLTQALRLRQPGSTLTCICIGTDRSTGDSLGPLVGSKLEEYAPPHLRIYGTLDEPVHAVNLQDTLNQVEKELKNSHVIAVDACLGQVKSVGAIQIGLGPLRPGAGVNKKLPAVGNVHITGIVNVAGFMEYFVLQNTRLNTVMKMADIIARSIAQSARLL